MALRAHDPARRAEPAAVGLLQRIAAVANEASSLHDAIQAALDEVCAHTGWPVGHAYLTVADGGLTPTGIWHFSDPARFSTFRAITEAMPMPRGVGLPGRILVSGQPAWITDVTSDA